jgi:hypothetical protein
LKTIFNIFHLKQRIHSSVNWPRTKNLDICYVDRIKMIFSSFYLLLIYVKFTMILLNKWALMPRLQFFIEGNSFTRAPRSSTWSNRPPSSHRADRCRTRLVAGAELIKQFLWFLSLH